MGRKRIIFGCFLFIVRIFCFRAEYRCLRWLGDLVSSMGLFGLNCSDRSHSLLSDYCVEFAVTLLMECDFLGKLLSAVCGFEHYKGNCGAIDVLESCLSRTWWCTLWSHWRQIIRTWRLRCDQPIFHCKTLLLEIGNRSAEHCLILN